jgi:hypothetical protein
MNCEQANQIDMVGYLHSIGHEPSKIRGNDYWYHSPLRDEKEPSFKINRNKNVWYDHGLGKGGTLVDFTIEYYHCNNVAEALQNLSFFQGQNLFQNSCNRPPFHSYEHNTFPDDTRETAIRIIAAKQPIQNPILCRYLNQRKIEKNIANKYCYEIQFTNVSNDKTYIAIGFKNNAGGYELRNEYFKGSSSPKYITYLDNSADKITVFEGFFDFLSYQTIHQNQQQEMIDLPVRQTNFLVLNSLSFFERSLLLMEKHQSIHLYLDQDEAGRKNTKQALKRSPNFKDESKLYKGYKDLNDWLSNFGRLKMQKNVRPSVHRHL